MSADDTCGSHESSEDVGPYRSVDIGSAFSHLPSKDMTRESPLGSPVLVRRNDVNSGFHHDPALHDPALHEKIIQLKKHHQIQQQILVQRFQAQQKQLSEEQEQQLQHLKELWEQQKLLEEQQRERHEKERLDALRKKDKHEESAVASSEVKQKLQGFLLKKQREAVAMANGAGVGAGTPLSPVPLSPSSSASTLTQQSQQSPTLVPGHQFRNWSVLQQQAAGESGVSMVISSGGSPHPYCLIGPYDDDFPLRKTASEPNLFKVRMKQRFVDRRSSPMARRKSRILPVVKRKSHLAIDVASSSPESGPNSPPSLTNRQPSPSAAGRNTPIEEEREYGQLSNSSQQGSMSDLSLFSSPSMPNISLGRPAASNSGRDGGKLAPVSEATFSAQRNVPLTGQILPGTLPYFPTLSEMEADFNPSSSPFIPKHIQSLETRSGGLGPAGSGHAASMVSSTSAGSSAGGAGAAYHGMPITDTQVAHARLNKQGHRPLGRTQSAPLPLGHPMLTGGPLSVVPGSNPSYEDYQHTTKHNLLKQQIRQTVLTRAGSRGLSTSSSGGQLDETDENAEVIDLTERRGEESDFSKHQREKEILQQQRDLRMRHTLQVSEGSAFSPRSLHAVRPLSRALSSPLVALTATDCTNSVPLGVASSGVHHITTGLAFDNLMLKHACICRDHSIHPEHGGRLQSVWARLMETGLVQRCDRIRSRKATLEEIQVCHTEAHTLLFGNKFDVNRLSQLPIKSFVQLPCGGIGVDSDTTWNETYTAQAARMAVGCVIDLTIKAANGDIRNGFAVVRPPGHHAEADQAMGFCFFNSVAIAARLVQQRLNVPRILIVDWDVHHGNGTQNMFYNDRRVLYLSIHRHDDANFFPGTGAPTECGRDEGLGFNVNVAWSGGLNPPMGDAEYLAAFRTIVMPIAKEYNPDIVLVSAGFDAANGHPAPLGGYKVSPACFGYMTQQLMTLAGGKVVLSLEGGYDLPAICDSAQECVRALLGDELSPLREEELQRAPCQNAVDTLQKTIAIQLSHWPCLKRLAPTVALSALEALQKERDEAETVTAMASLSMQHQTRSLQKHSCDEPMDQDDAK